MQKFMRDIISIEERPGDTKAFGYMKNHKPRTIKIAHLSCRHSFRIVAYKGAKRTYCFMCAEEQGYSL